MVKMQLYDRTFRAQPVEGPPYAPVRGLMGPQGPHVAYEKNLVFMFSTAHIRQNPGYATES